MFNKILTKAMLPMALSVILLGCNSEQVADSKPAAKASEQDRPNIILIVSDDHGYGDIGANQNPIIQTPQLDNLANTATTLTNFHVDPTCSPTRSALMSGKYSLRAGVWHTILARYFLGQEHKTMATRLNEGGYDTAIFGKWHLGDNYPYRPQDHGFDEVLIHGGGGVGQTPDYWGNTQFNDTYYHNGKPEAFEGYATKVWFDQAIKYIQTERDNPYFVYLPLNAPHGPWRAPESYVKAYEDKGLPNDMARYYAMITYMDEQIGRLQTALKATGEYDNTIFMFMTDNGSSYKFHNKKDYSLNKQFVELQKQYPDWNPNAGRRGYKSDVYDGGNRVPLYIQYPNGKLANNHINTLAAHFDLLPTLLDLAGISYDSTELDGTSLVELITKGKDTELEDRSFVITNQRVDHPSYDRPAAVAKGEWRYVRASAKSQELFNLEADPMQQKDVKKQYPELAAELDAKLQGWWQEMETTGFPERYIHVGNPAEDPVRLNAMDWKEVPAKQPVAWFTGHQIDQKETDYTHWLTEEADFPPLPWYIDVEKAGTYKVTICYHDLPAGTPIMKKSAVFEVNGKRHVAPVYGRAHYATIEVQLEAGKQKIRSWFSDDVATLAEEKSAFFVYLDFLQ